MDNSYSDDACGVSPPRQKPALSEVEGAMGPCLDAVGKRTVVEQRAMNDFKPLAKQRTSHRIFRVGCLRLSSPTPQVGMCHRFSLDHE